MLLGNVDTIEFGVKYDNKKTSSMDVLKNIAKKLFDEVKIYYTSSKGYDKQYHHLASKLNFKKNNRFKLIAFLYTKELDNYITVVQHSQSSYLTFKCYGLFQFDDISIKKRDYTYSLILSIEELGYLIKGVKIDIAFDFKMDFESMLYYLAPIFEKRKRYPYIFKDDETVYFNSELVNDCLFEQKKTKEDLKCNQKNTYLNVVLYNKSKKNSLEKNLTRLEFSFKNNSLGINNKTFSSFYSEIENIISILKKKINRYFNKRYSIKIQDFHDMEILSLHDGAVNNADYVRKIDEHLF